VAESSSATADPHGPRPRPRLRGLFHQYAFFVAIVLGGLLIAGASHAQTRVAAIVFAVAADVDWGVALLIAVGSIVGGRVGAHVGRRLPPVAFRLAIVVVGTAAIVKLTA